jgi:hypothetical protein
MTELATRIAAATLVFSFASAALADPTNPVVVDPAPEDQGEIFSPGVRLVSDLSKDYVEEEYFVSGVADRRMCRTRPGSSCGARRRRGNSKELS